MNSLTRNKLKSFHNRCARFITGNHIRKKGEEWLHPSTVEVLEKAKLLRIDKYISRRKENVK